MTFHGPILLSHLLKGLTDAQIEAVKHIEGPLLILAGPGSGKTRVVTHRIAFLIEQGIPATEILALTFTNKAAEEMRARVERLSSDHSVWVSTYHRFCARMLRKHASLGGLEENYTIYDAEEARRTLRRVIEHEKVELGHFSPDALATAISWAKNRLILPDQYAPRPGHPLGEIVKRIYPAYQSQLLRSNAADFDDLLLHVAVMLRENPEIRRTLDNRFRYVLVDEYQDTNLAQYAIARALSIDASNLAVTGDPDQSIYGWRGANLNNILEFEKDFPEVHVVRLERNYRSTQRILHVADKLINHNLRRKAKGLYTKNDEGDPVRLITYADQREEARSIAERILEQVHSGTRRPRDIAVFYRVNALSWPFELAFRELGVAYQIVRGQEFFQRKEIKDVLGYLQLINNPRDDAAFLRIINTPLRGIGKVTLERLASHAMRNGRTLLEAASESREIELISARTASLIEKFVRLFDKLTTLAAAPVEEILGFVLTETDYKEQYKRSKSDEDQQRVENIEQLLSVAREFDERTFRERPLEEFLEETSLVNETDTWDAENDRVTLMTLHASKGLEFASVYLVAIEEGLMPHERSRDREAQLEEERRLMFVGITRAQEELQISMAARRDFRGQRKTTIPSQFLLELPRGEMDVRDLAAIGASWTEPRKWQAEPDVSTQPFSDRPRVAVGVQVTTAAEMAGTRPLSTPDVKPDDFYQGMVVQHPRYGLGRVVALGGSGDHRTATVDFATGAGRRKFVIAQSPIKPAKKKSR